MRVIRHLPLALVALLAVTASTVLAQSPMRRQIAEVSSVVESAATPGSTVRAALKVRLPAQYHMNANEPRDPNLIPASVSVEAVDGITVESVSFPPPAELKQEAEPVPLLVFEHDFAIGVQLTVASTVPVGLHGVPVRLRYQACDEKQCYMPMTATASFDVSVVAAGTPITKSFPDVFDTIDFSRKSAATVVPASAAAPPRPAPPVATGDPLQLLDRFTIAGSEGGYLPVSDFTAFLKAAESGEARKGMLEGRGPLAILLIVFIGGLALNLTPCVLPMIPINLAIIGAGAQAGSRSRGLLLGSVYGGAMAIVYGVLGLIVILTAGTFGTINASPWFNLAIAILFIALALAMFDLFEIDFSRFSSGVGVGAGRGSLMLAFTMGSVAALLAGACVAPVVIQVVLFSTNLYATGTTAALALPFVLGIGMAVPWPLAGAGVAALPAPGAWMVRVKQAFGVVILLTAAYYGYTAFQIFRDRSVDPAQVSSSVEAKLKEGWHSSLAEGLATAQRENKPVLVDMWATWCKNCLTMDATTLVDPQVRSALDGYVKVKFQAEVPDESPALEVMQRFGAVGLPTYVVLTPKP